MKLNSSHVGKIVVGRVHRARQIVEEVIREASADGRYMRFSKSGWRNLELINTIGDFSLVERSKELK